MSGGESQLENKKDPLVFVKQPDHHEITFPGGL